ncbi:MAG: pleD, partial [Chlamydiales bacterium]|nr:pleD [Chlamydiales bacterium]
MEQACIFAEGEVLSSLYGQGLEISLSSIEGVVWLKKRGESENMAALLDGDLLLARGVVLDDVLEKASSVIVLTKKPALLAGSSLSYDDFLQLPVDPDELNLRVKRALTSRKTQKHVEELIFELRDQSGKDSLTHVYNRKMLQEVCNGHSPCLNKSSLSKVCSLMIDIDHFKSINDTFGHLVGDEVLIELAKRLQDHLRKNDLVFRLGGDEFLVLLPDTDLEQALFVAEKLSLQIGKIPFQTKGGL